MSFIIEVYEEPWGRMYISNLRGLWGKVYTITPNGRVYAQRYESRCSAYKDFQKLRESSNHKVSFIKIHQLN
jgi:hypothetical protein